MKKNVQLLFLFLLTKSSVIFSQSNIMFLFHSLPQEKIIELPGNLSLSYVEQGSPEGTPVIFLHGYTDSWHSFDSVLVILPKSLHAFAISQRGHGNSDRPLSGYAPGDFASDVAAFVRKMNLGPVIVVGHSLGGVIAQRFALDYPELTKGLVIAASASSFSKNEVVMEFQKEVNKLSEPVNPAFVEEFQRATISKHISETYLSVLVRESLKLSSQTWKDVLNELMNYDHTNELKKLDKLTLIVWGDKDAFCFLKDQEILQQSIRGSTLLVYKGIGHAVHWEESRRFSNDLSDFIYSLNKPN